MCNFQTPKILHQSSKYLIFIGIMKKIGLISDTHGYLDPRLLDLLQDVDELWHAGDIGSLDVLQQLRDFKPLRAVWGNADGNDIRTAIDPRPRYVYSSDNSATTNAQQARQGILRFSVEDITVLMTHIGGYPGHYSLKVINELRNDPPTIMVAGHSHILRVIYDKKYHCLHLNPGACGHYGIQGVRTALRFTIDASNIKDMEIIELS